MARIYDGVGELIGNTPLMRLHRIEAAQGLEAELIVKLESFNPLGSAKDRVGFHMLEVAEKEGLINQNSTIIEPTSGNTGVGLASAAAAKGYKIIIVMPDTMSVERRRLMLALGAELVLTDGARGMKGAIEKAVELNNQIPNSYIPQQFENPANPEAHRLTTGPEILRDTDGRLDYFVAGVGTGGTITGVGEVLKSNIEGVKIIAVEPIKSAVLSGGAAGAHGLQGIGAGFIPAILNTSVYDEVIDISDEEAVYMARAAARLEGILIGISGGAALAAAVKIAKREKGKRVLALLPDTGERYLSSGLYD